MKKLIKKMGTWNIDEAEKELNLAFENNSEVELLNVIKKNSFFFYELYSRKWGIQPNFSEISFDGKLRCDFAWLNDNSDGPEWVLVEIEKPKMRIFNKDGSLTSGLSHAIEQVISWDRYFSENPGSKRRIFGAVAKFRYILVAGDKSDWSTDNATKWRSHFNREHNNFEIRTSDIFHRAITVVRECSGELWSFEEHPVS
jgi:hypothetical protein